MKKLINFGLLSLVLLVCCGAAPRSASLMGPAEDDMEIFVNNRVLATVNQKPITVMDVTKKLDLTFYSQYPQYSTSIPARYQYYANQWKGQLVEMVDRELVIADASQSKMEITNGDIRKEIETIFGPNVIVNLDKAKLTMDEAWQMVHDDILLRRIMMAKVNTKAIRQASPQHIRNAYQEYAKENVRPEQWVYRVISVRDENTVRGAETANTISSLIADYTGELDVVFEELKEVPGLSEDTSVTVSDEISNVVEEIIPNYKPTLENLTVGSFSEPVSQKGRKDGKIVHRIFFLKDKVEGGVVPLVVVSNELKEKLLSEAVNSETEKYILKLRRQYGYDQESAYKSFTDDFEPYKIKPKY